MSQIREVKMQEIVTSPNQPRMYFDGEAIESLAISIRENGLVQPITVREKGEVYELVAGERRFRACQYLKFETIPAYVVSSSDRESMYMSLIENIQREDLSSIEEAKAYLRIMQLNNMTQKELSEKIGKSQPSVANKIRLLNLDINVQNAIETKIITERHARALLSVNKDKQNEVLSRVIKENLNVAQTERVIKNATEKSRTKTKTKGYSRDLQVGINTIKKACEMIEKSGLQVYLNENAKDNHVVLEIKLTSNKD